MSADTAAFAIEKVCFKKALFGLIYATFRAKYIAHAAFYALLEIMNRQLRTPITRLVLTGIPGFTDYTAGCYFLPCNLVFLFSQL
jgi:hypothetical protein